MRYAERVSHRVINRLQSVVSYVEMDDKTKALEVLRIVIVEVQELIAVAVLSDRDEQAS